MENLKSFEIIKLNKELEGTFDSNPYEILILSNIVVNQLRDVLEYNLRLEGINANVNFGDYDNIVQDSYMHNNYNLIIIFWELSNFSDSIYYDIENYDNKKLEQIINSKKSEIELVIKNLKNIPLVLINKFNSSSFKSVNNENSNYDFLMNELNNFMKDHIGNNTKLIDLSNIFQDITISKSIDKRYFYSSKSLYTNSFFKSYSNLIKPILMSANGKSKKALIFDCDNTLWSGVLGEDGFDNIEMSPSTPKGIFFHEVQKIANYFSKKGVLIGLCSKNNLDDVQNVITNHSDFIIDDNIIIIKKVNWTDKATNLREISSELNIGLGSIIFVDDSSFEINLINSQIPEIKTIQVPKTLSEYPNLIYDCQSFFYNLSSTTEDSRKNKMYKENIERKSSERKFNNLNDFLKSLNIELNIVKDDFSNIPRISQMTQKTNQFNLTTKRYTENEIEIFLNSKEHTLYSFSVLDKFGDNGITGLVILKISNDVVLIDTFLMSCRIIGRKIENAFINFLLNELKLQGKKLVNANYIKTKKNVQVEKFYDNIGFNVDRCQKENTSYILNLKEFKSQKINFIKLNFNGK